MSNFWKTDISKRIQYYNVNRTSAFSRLWPQKSGTKKISKTGLLILHPQFPDHQEKTHDTSNLGVFGRLYHPTTTVHEWHSHSLSSGIILVVVVKNLLVYLFRLHIRKTKPRNITAIKKLKSQTLQGCTIHVLLLKFSLSQGWSGLCMCEVKGRKGSMRESERTSQDLKSRSGCRAVSTIVY